MEEAGRRAPAPSTGPCVLDFLNGYALLGAANAAAHLRLPQILPRSKSHGLSVSQIAQQILVQKPNGADNSTQNINGEQYNGANNISAQNINGEHSSSQIDGRRHVALHRILLFPLAHHLLLCHTPPDGLHTFSLPPLPDGAAEDPWDAIAPFVAFLFHPYQHSTWLKLPDMIVHGADFGDGPKFYEVLDSDPVLSGNFNAAMAAVSSSYVNAFCNAKSYDMDPHRRASSFLDVGGGNGIVAARIARRYPHLTRVLNFDLPFVIASAPHRDGVEHIPGDMFQSVPSADIIFLKSVLHNWPDQQCIQILQNCRKSLVGLKKVVILDTVIESTARTITNKTGNISNLLGRLSLDIAMMANHFEGARERTKDDWETILKAVGFESYKFVELEGSLYSVIEATTD